MQIFRLAALILAIGIGSPALAQTVAPASSARSITGLDQPLAKDPRVIVGTLPNGLRYYIRKNTHPEKRAELRLVVNAGSILEDEDQLGLAHFLEHTAFNGTTNFRKNELVSYLESIGVRFGADLNAYTSFDETVYILPIPTDTARVVERAFQILEDWAHGQVFDSTEVANEIGIVVEEWRGRRGAGDRMLQQWLPIALGGSPYASRLPVGTREGIEGATPERLRRFYNDWYRPDLMAVIAVGDFDPARIQALIEKHFSRLKTPEKPRPRLVADVPDNREPRVAIATDHEATNSSVELLFKLPSQPRVTVGDFRRHLAERLYLTMLNRRLSEISQRPDAPFLGANASRSGFLARTRDAFVLSANVKDGGMERGLEALLIEARRVDEHGFLAAELDRAKQGMLRGYERTWAEREKTHSGSFVGAYIRHFLHGDVAPGIERELELVQQLLPTITLEEVNGLARQWITDENRVIIAQAPRKDGVAVPTERDLLAVFDRAKAVTVAAYTETLSEEPLLSTTPAPRRVAAERTMPAVAVTEWRLPNGARVLFKSTDFKDDEVVFSAHRPGGHSLAEDADYMSAALSSQVVSLSGIGGFNRIDLGKKLTGKVASVSPSISEISEGLSGRASPRDLETLFQLIHLHFTSPRLDSAAFQAFRQAAMQQLANRGAAPGQVFSDTIMVTMAQNHFRARPMTPDVFGEVDPAKSFAFYRDRFSDATGFTFIFVGNVAAETLRPLVERYLATLPATGRKHEWRDRGRTAPKGRIEKVVRRGSEPRATTVMFFTGRFDYTPEHRFALRALSEVYQLKLTETLREQLGGTYSPSVGASSSQFPRPEYTIRVEFGSSPENVEPLTRSALELIDSLRTRGPSAADVDKVREQILREREVALRQNAYWAANIASRDRAGEPLEDLLEPYDAMVRGLTPEQVRRAAQRYFDPVNYARFVLLPAEPAAQP